mmetsp:Transcript_65875/g.91594  ORF Transcript_65875/g.91594 Transcript_65875/m.91594 type:complete len:387 (+) Transcript_65875:45-1205(+)
MSYNTDVGMELNPIVIDNGSGVLKAGLGGELKPTSVFPNCVGRAKHVKIMGTDGIGRDEEFVGPKAAGPQYRGLLKIKYPVEHGIVEDWNSMEKLWHYLYSKEQLGKLDINAQEHGVLLTEAPLNPKSNREDACKVLFETFNVPAVYVSMQAVLSLFASGLTTGLVLDSGDGVTHAVPIYEGYALEHSIQRSDVAGRDITRYLQLLLRKEGHVFRSSSEFEIVREMKESACYFPEDEKKAELHEPDREEPMYTLPDGKTISLGPARFRAPEALFNPALIGEESLGIHEVLTNAIARSDMDLRRNLWQGIVLSGGSTMFKGFCKRLLKETRKIAPPDMKIRITAPTDRQFTTFTGGSILATLSSYKSFWVTKGEYEEKGPEALRKLP